MRESLLRSEECAQKNQGFRPAVIGRTVNFDYIGDTSFGLLGRSLEDRIAWVVPGPDPGATRVHDSAHPGGVHL